MSEDAASKESLARLNRALAAEQEVDRLSCKLEETERDAGSTTEAWKEALARAEAAEALLEKATAALKAECRGPWMALAPTQYTCLEMQRTNPHEPLCRVCAVLAEIKEST